MLIGFKRCTIIVRRSTNNRSPFDKQSFDVRQTIVRRTADDYDAATGP
jgi:hypothetical protein